MGFRRKGKRRKRKEVSSKVVAGATPADDENEEDDECREKKLKLSNQAAYQQYTPIEQRNVVMEAYYDYQGLHNTYFAPSSSVLDRSLRSCKHSFDLQQKEKELFYSTIRRILPASFRIGQDCPEEFRRAIENQIQEYVVGISMDDDINDGSSPSKVIGVVPIPYIPHAYQLNVDRKTIRRHPKLSEFHDWLKIITDAGFVTRQETVSMIPPIILNVQPHHTVLDMCAAPGSKTSQLLEIVTSSNNDSKEPRGFVVANEVDEKRAYMLVHQLRRIQSPAIFITSCDAQSFPSTVQKDEQELFLFDRVLADVPCSGDGTVRKNLAIWKNWSLLGPLGLHPVQVSIAKEGARLTKVGGYLVYSTCSLNPIENEAVVAELLRSCNGTLQLVDPRTQEHGGGDDGDRIHLLARPGWTTWKVMSQSKPKRTKGKFKPKMIAKRQLFAAGASTQQQKQGDENRKDLQHLPDNELDDNNFNTTPEDLTSSNVSGNEIEQEEDAAEQESAASGKDDIKSMDDGTTEDICMMASQIDNAESKKDSSSYWEEDSLRRNAIQVGLIPYDTFEDVPMNERSRVRKSCFPPTEEECTTMHLERCLRILPQDMDTGGFFVALFLKIAPTSGKKKSLDKQNAATATTGDPQKTGHEDGTASVTTATDNVTVTARSNSSRIKANLTTAKIISGNSDFVAVNEAIWPSLATYYGLSENFPKDQLMSREYGKAKVLYFITKAIKNNLIDNGIQEKAMVINSGLRAFERNNKDCDVEYRVTQEGIHYIAPYMTKRFFVVNATDFCICLNPGTTIWIGNFSSEFQAQIRDLSTGALVVSLSGFETDIAKKMFLVMWKCRGDSLNCLVSQVEQLGITCKLRALGLLVQIPELKKPPRQQQEQQLVEHVVDASNGGNSKHTEDDCNTSLDTGDTSGQITK